MGNRETEEEEDKDWIGNEFVFGNEKFSESHEHSALEKVLIDDHGYCFINIW